LAKRDDNRRARRGRRAGTALVVSAATLAAVVFIAPRLVPGPMLAGRVVEALTAATGAEVTVGQARLTLVGGPGLQVSNARLVRAGSYDVALERADVSLAVLPLVGKRLVVDGARASGAVAQATWRGQPVALADFALKARGLNYELPKPGQAAVAPAGGPLLPPGLEGSLSVRLGHGAWTTFAVDDLELEASLKKQVVIVRSVSCRTAGGGVSATGTWDRAVAGAAAVAGTVRLEGVEAAALLRPWAPEVATQLEARVSGDAKLACTLGDAATVRSTLSGEGSLRADTGVLRTGPWLADAKQYLGDRQDLIDIRFTELRHVFRVAGGTFAVDTLALRGPDTDWDLAGTLGFDGNTNLTVHLCLPPDFVPNLGSMTMYALALRDAERRVNLDITVQGPLADPVVGLDFAAMARRLAKPRSDAG
jgi:hypothetical protein